MDPVPDYAAVIAQVCRQLKRLTREQMTTRVVISSGAAYDHIGHTCNAE
jgi:hypothetical protein